MNRFLGEYTMVLRLSEQYLIRAEARAHQDNLQGAEEDINAVQYYAPDLKKLMQQISLVC